jgi:hypothetical protein
MLRFFDCQELCSRWRDYSTRNDEHVEHLIGNPGYAEADMFFMHRIGVHEVAEGSKEITIRAYDMMRAGLSKRIKVDWGIGGLKSKFRRFKNPFENPRPRFNKFLEQ